MKAAVVSAKGIGDGLMMMVASHRLLQTGYHVTTYHNLLHELSLWFPGHCFKNCLKPYNLEKALARYDLIILQNDNTPLSFAIIDLYKQGKLHNLSVFYSSYCPIKHSSLTSWDRIFDRHRPMVENIATAIASVLQCKHISKNNGIVPPKELVHRKNCNRIVIHPAATSPNRWDLQKFVNIATRLQKDGFEVVFCVSSIERKEWFSLLGDSFVLPHFPTLAELASFIFESGYLIGNDSGPGHMASNLQLPTLTIANSAKRMALWRPGWLEGKVVAPLPFIPNFKGLRLREKKWKAFISTKRVLNHFYQLIT